MPTPAQNDPAIEPHRASAGAASWHDDAAGSWEPSSPARDDLYVTCWRDQPTEGEPEPLTTAEYIAADGMPARGVVIVTLLGSGACAAIDVALTGRLSLFFDLCFVTVCLAGAMAVRRADLFTAGVLAPLAFAAVVLAVSLGSPQAIVAAGDVSRVFLTGLAQHAGALVSGYAVALGTVAGRVAAARV
jgi:hypothetical protein